MVKTTSQSKSGRVFFLSEWHFTKADFSAKEKISSPLNGKKREIEGGRRASDKEEVEKGK